MLLDLEDHIGRVDLGKSPEEGRAFAGDFIYELLERASLTFSSADMVLKVVGRLSGVESFQTQGGLQFVEKFQWIPSLGITYFNGADGFGLPMLLLTGIVFFTGVLTMWELQTRVKEFFALLFRSPLPSPVVFVRCVSLCPLRLPLLSFHVFSCSIDHDFPS